MNTTPVTDVTTLRAGDTILVGGALATVTAVTAKRITGRRHDGKGALHINRANPGKRPVSLVEDRLETVPTHPEAGRRILMNTNGYAAAFPLLMEARSILRSNTYADGDKGVLMSLLRTAATMIAGAFVQKNRPQIESVLHTMSHTVLVGTNREQHAEFVLLLYTGAMGNLTPGYSPESGKYLVWDAEDAPLGIVDGPREGLLARVHARFGPEVRLGSMRPLLEDELALYPA